MGSALALRILQTTDLHGHIRPYDYYADAPAPGSGLAALAPIVRSARDEAPNSLFFDCGDLIQGTPLSDLAVASGGTNPAVDALNVLDCDAATLGNHDVDFGFVQMQRAFTGRTWPLVSANLRDLTGAPVFPPHIMLKREFRTQDGITIHAQIGVLGTLPPQTAMWNGHHLKGHATIGDMLSAAKASAQALRDEGANLVIALAHSGLGDAQSDPGAENVALAMVAIEEIDVVLAGHTHVFVPKVGEVADSGPLVLQPGANGSHLGQMDLLIETGSARWQIKSARRQIIAASDLADPAILRVTEGAHEKTLHHIRQEIGRTRVPLCSHLNLVGHDASARLIADAMIWRTKALFPHRSCLAAIAPFRAGGFMGPGFYTNIPAGPLTLRHVAELYLYPNEFRVIEVSGSVLRDWLDHAAGLYAQISLGGGVQDLTLPKRPTYNADAMFGLTYEIDLTQPPRFDAEGHQISDQSRIFDLRFEGHEVGPDDNYAVATNSYRASGGGGFAFLSQCPVLDTPPEIAREILARYLRDAGDVTPAPEMPFRFRGLGGQEVRFFTAPEADLTDISNAVRSEKTPDGFQVVRLTL